MQLQSIAGKLIALTKYEDCKECLECVKRCLSKSLDGKGWKNVYHCASHGCCGTCLSVCPVVNSKKPVSESTTG